MNFEELLHLIEQGTDPNDIQLALREQPVSSLGEYRLGIVAEYRRWAERKEILSLAGKHLTKAAEGVYPLSDMETFRLNYTSPYDA